MLEILKENSTTHPKDHHMRERLRKKLTFRHDLLQIMLSHPWHFSTKGARKNSLQILRILWFLITSSFHHYASSILIKFERRKSIFVIVAQPTPPPPKILQNSTFSQSDPPHWHKLTILKMLACCQKKNCHLNILREYTKYVRTEESNKKSEKKNMKSHLNKNTKSPSKIFHICRKRLFKKEKKKKKKEANSVAFTGKYDWAS